jgi:hypothetical protein
MGNPITINFKGLFIDAYKVIKGFFAILRYSISKDKVCIGLALFTTESQDAKVGHNSIYTIDICNASRQRIWVKLLFDIHLKEDDVPRAGHYCYIEKAIFVKDRDSQSLRIIYDWKDYVVVDIDDVSFEPDVFWSGNLRSEGKYFVKSLLLDEKGATFDELTLLQNLSE